jgi:hypothetical protein
MEALLLKKMGGSGTINPATGLREFRGYSSSDRAALDRHVREVAERPDYNNDSYGSRPTYTAADRAALDRHVREIGDPRSAWKSAARVLGPALGSIFGGPAGFSLGTTLSRSMTGDEEGWEDSDLGRLVGTAADTLLPGISLLGSVYSNFEDIRNSLGGGIPFQRDSTDWGSTPDHSGGFWGAAPPRRHATHNERRRWTEIRHKPINRRYRPRPDNHPTGEAWQYFDEANPPWEFDYIERD